MHHWHRGGLEPSWTPVDSRKPRLCRWQWISQFHQLPLKCSSLGVMIWEPLKTSSPLSQLVMVECLASWSVGRWGGCAGSWDQKRSDYRLRIDQRLVLYSHIERKTGILDFAVNRSAFRGCIEEKMMTLNRYPMRPALYISIVKVQKL